MKNEYNDISVEKLLPMMEDLINQGFNVYIKWICENCQERITCTEPNCFFTQGWKHEDCGFISHPKKFGLLAMGVKI